ncbi:MAG: SDR family NAD(P)-dependent oxidoreductase [Nakamurella sp.]
MSVSDSPRRTAIVTGGARGIGQACAVRLAQAGHDVAVVDLIDATEAADAVRAAGGRSLTVRCDVSIPDDITHAFAAVDREFGGCDVLVNNAGIFPRRSFAELDLDLWHRVLDVNLTATFLFCKAVVPGMTEREFGRIINISSDTVGLPVENVAHYITSKSAIIGFIRALASEIGKHGITVNSVAPGLTPTAGLLANQPNPAVGEQLFAGIVERQPIKRISQPTDVAAAVAWFASDEAGFITAQTLVVDGGLVRLG